MAAFPQQACTVAMLPPCGRTVDASRRHYPCATPDRASTAHAGHAPRAPASKLPRAPRRRSGIRRSRVPAESDGIGFLNDLSCGPSYIAAPRELSILLDEKSTVVPVAWPESSREASEGFFMETLGRTQSERRRRLALAGGFRLLRSSGIDRLDAPAHAAGRGSAGPDD